ncbi:poly(R)-hydroxyalkanoic acid synthase subunit PhaE [Rurimicrobium arvi]
MAKLNGSNFMESMLETQKNMVDTMVENTKKMTNGNTVINETINKGSEWYNNWLDSQKKAISATTEKAETFGSAAQEQANKMNEQFTNWQTRQMDAAKQLWDMNQNWFKSSADQARTFDMSNPTALYQAWYQQMNNMMNNMTQQNWMNQFQNWSKSFMPQQNPFSMDQFRNYSDNMTSLFNQYTEMMNYNMASMQKSFQAGTPQEAFKNMMNVNNGFMRFMELWSPMMSAIQNKTFNMDAFRKMTDPGMMKGFMDNLFGLMPDPTQHYFNGLRQLMQDGMKQVNVWDSFRQMKGMMGGMMPSFAPNEMMENSLGYYNTMRNSLNSVFAPMGKMMGQNEYTRAMTDWSDIADKMIVFSIKNAEMQTMIYEKGTKVMEKVAESIVNKQENGEEVGSLMALYQEWLNISDAEFVTLFESDAYAQVMADVASLKMKLGKEIDMKLEKMFSNIPVATRSDMEEVYKMVYDLKKQVRQLEKMLDMETAEEEEVAPAKPNAARKNAKK